MRALLAAGLAALALAAPAGAAENVVLTAYGEGDPAVCIVSVKKHEWFVSDWIIIRGKTDCNRPVQQSGEAWLDSEDGYYTLRAPLCSGLRADCVSGTDDTYPWEVGPAYYRVQIIAPLGQGWAAAPDACSGAGTDNLRCTFMTDGLGGFEPTTPNVFPD